MVRAFVAIGSNIDAAANVRSALRLLARSLSITALSTVYETQAEGRSGQARFYDCVVEVETDLAPPDLKFGVLRSIEAQLGRKRGSDKCADRTIDLDLVVYGDLVRNGPDLTLPDPELFRRFFIAAPLAELAPDMIVPGSNLRASQLAAAVPRNEAESLASYTAQLRNELGL